jgi:hypothetical protein
LVSVVGLVLVSVVGLVVVVGVFVGFMAELFLRVDGLRWRSEPATGSPSEIRDDKPWRAGSPRGVTRSEGSSDDPRVNRLEEERERADGSHSPTPEFWTDYAGSIGGVPQLTDNMG